MTLEQQCVSLPLAKRLKSLGVKQDSYFKWQKYRTGTFSIWNGTEESEFQTEPFTETYSAFTSSELGEMLPQFIDRKDGVRCILKFHKYVNGWWVSYEASKTNDNIVDQMADTEADARAKMLIYLLENNLITLTCTRKITPVGRRESTKIKIGDSSNEENIYRRADRWYFTGI